MLAGVDHLPATYDREKQAFTKGEPEYGAALRRRSGAPRRPARRLDHRRGDRRAVAGSTGTLPPPKGYLRSCARSRDKHGILLIFDEVITGFGRLGAAFAADATASSRT
jgi:beta-alanine--pyruvate transaminase